MICLECNSTEIDYYIGSTFIIKEFDSIGLTGKNITKIFNPTERKPYRIKCSKCKELLKEGLKIRKPVIED
jgi:predicted nucleic-acid-binding Zn-ribbon protein